MHGDLRSVEDLSQVAAEAFEVAQRLCGSCRNYHSLWTYQRIAGASGGGVAAPVVQAVLGRLLSAPGRKILIAGCADTGLLAVVSRAAHPHSHIVVLDQCETPLELCRRFARRAALAVETLRLNLEELPAESTFDVVLAHSLLQHIAADRRIEVLSRLRRSLRPGGRLVLVSRTSDRIGGKLLPEYREGYARHLLEQLEAMKIPLPEPHDAFRRRIETYAEEHRAREGAHASREELEQLIEAAGFAIQDLMPIDASQSDPFRVLAAKISKQRFLVIAANQAQQ
jgi:2-polyprenyl-3-methyl-5-hydroxy-6-metoxy-1,4-benzoquinol methylase